ncbi:hypothetical protein ABZW03_25935 [Kitasatospora sp. NPDC004799]|uniref:hypothetical protein n=1 Tax=Kitasatospora sp. NPDC004799 TaxID=3154460 RepID=UPI0033B24589
MTSADFVPLRERRRGLRLSTYMVDSTGRRHSATPVIEVAPGPPTVELNLDFWPDCTCPLHRTG